MKPVGQHWEFSRKRQLTAAKKQDDILAFIRLVYETGNEHDYKHGQNNEFL